MKTHIDNTGDILAVPLRFWKKVAVDKSCGCWNWTACKTKGYGQFQVGHKRVIAHRYIYTALVSPIADGMVIDHLCRNTACVNPRHLEAVSQQNNVRRGIGQAAINALKTHCANGHLFDDVNTYIKPNGARNCKACQQRRSRTYEMASRRKAS